MSRRWSIALALLVLGILFASTTLSVSADASVSSYTVYCDHFVASGESDRPYVTLWAFNNETEEEVYAILPVTGGHYSGSVGYTLAPTGTTFYVEVWGTLAPYENFDDPNYYDRGDYFYNEAAPCVPPPPSAACTYPLPTDSVVYDVPLGAQAYFAPDTQSSANFILPAGTWKISEFDGDFAKVWISCQATPVWIPKTAIGGAIG